MLNTKLRFGCLTGALMGVRRYVVLLLVIPFTLEAGSQTDSGKNLVVDQKRRLLVELNVANRPEHLLLDEESIERNRQKIAHAQQQFQSWIQDSSATVVHEFKTILYVSIMASGSELDQLQDSELIKSIQNIQSHQMQLYKSAGVIGANLAWSRGFAGLGQTVAVLDSGVDSDHVHFSSNIIEEACFLSGQLDFERVGRSFDISQAGREFLSDRENQLFKCPNGTGEQVGPGAAMPCENEVALGGCHHGTMVAGIVAGRSTYVSGVARSAGLVAVRVTEPAAVPSGFSMEPQEDNVLRALEWLYLNRFRLNLAAINMSFGSEYFGDGDCPGASVYETLIRNLKAVGIVTIAASGNFNRTSIMSPACLPDVISVGATHIGDEVWSNTHINPSLDLLAPGAGYVDASRVGNYCSLFDRSKDWGICTTMPYSSGENGGYGHDVGTSLAAPQVSGAWAVVKSQYPTVSVDAWLAHLKRTGVPIIRIDSFGTYSIPRLDLGAATSCPDPIFCPLLMEFTADF